MRETFDYILSLLKSRIVPLVLVFIVMFSIIVGRIFNLQIINGDSYVSSLSDSIKKTTSVAATRGRIFDKNGVLLAYNEIAFAVKISDSGTYSSTTIKNNSINSAIEKTLTIIESKNDKFSNDFQIVSDGAGGFAYTVSDNALLRFKRDTYGARTLSELTDEQRNSSANEMIDFLCNKYEINKDDYSVEHLLEIINLRVNMSANSYNRYVSFTIANEVSDDTMAAVLENSGDLPGVIVEQQYVRRYVNSVYCSQVLGYTGTISTTELETLNAQSNTYENNDVVGKTGIEQAMETELAGTKGSKTVYVDTVGRITEVVEETDAVAGNDVYLTIDINLQKEIYEEIEDQIVKILLTYITSGDEKYEYNSSGEVSRINIPIKEIYFALVNNNLISLDKMALCEHEAETEVYNSYLVKKDNTFAWLENELRYGSTKYGSLTDEQKAYIWYIYKDLLCSNKIFNTSKVDTNDALYKDWINGNNTSLTELLKYGITQNWIDMSLLADQQYTSLSESYDILCQYIIDQLYVDNNFSKKMYKYMINNVDITGRQLIMILFEQGYLDSEDDYTYIRENRMSPYNFMVDAITTKKITPAELALEPCSGSCVMTDPDTGKVLALVSYPSYDNNKMSGTVDAEYYSKLSNDNSKPLTNYATQAQNAPGSIFKICSSIAGLDQGVIDTSTEFFCSGSFNEIDPPPRCWQRWGHGTENVSTAIRDSCNVYFYNVGFRLGKLRDGSYNSTYALSILKNYAEQMGIATKAGIEISEKAPHASTEDAIRSAIGQGTHQYSALNLARYVTTIANSGTCYNLTLIDKITDNSGNLIRENEAEVASTMNISSGIWNAVHYGMYLATESYADVKNVGITVGSKTGTAQESGNDPDHATMISYAPYENPQVAMSVIIRNGYGSGYTATLTANILKTYFGLE